MGRMNSEVLDAVSSFYNHRLSNPGDDFDEADFSVPSGDHPDEISLDSRVSSEHLRRRNSLSNRDHPQNSASREDNRTPRLESSLTGNQTVVAAPGPQTPNNSYGNGRPQSANPMNAQRDPVQAQRPRVPPFPQQTIANPPHAAQSVPQQPLQNKQPIAHPSPESSLSADTSLGSQHEPPVGFFTARAAESLQNAQGFPPKAPAFDPHLESPSIRKTAGVDHTKTKPINREALASPAVAVPQRSNFVNPQTDKARKVGMPSAASPLQNRGSYKPPMMKRPAEGGRPALGDVTSGAVNVPSDAGGEAKRQRVRVEGTGNGEGMLNE